MSRDPQLVCAMFACHGLFSSATVGHLAHPGCEAHLSGAVLWIGLVKWLGSLLGELFFWGEGRDMGRISSLKGCCVAMQR